MVVNKHRDASRGIAATQRQGNLKGNAAAERKRLEARMEAHNTGDSSDDASDIEQHRRLARMEARDSDDETGGSDSEDSDEDTYGGADGGSDESGSGDSDAELESGDDEYGTNASSEGDEDDEDDEREESEDEEIQAMRKLQEELADMPFEQVQAMRNSMGAKKFDALQRDLASIDKLKEEKDNAKKSGKPQKIKRENKNRPREMSSKKPVTRYREVVAVTKSRARDPRFDSLSGSFNKDLFEKSYSFLGEYRKAEVEQLHKELKKEKDEDRRREIQSVISRMKQQERQKHMEEQKAALKRKQRKVEKEAVAQGKKPYYPKKSELKLMERVSKYKDIAAQGEGKVKDYIAKRRKKNAAKDHRFVPYERR